MNTLESIYARRSVKYYDPNFKMPVEDEKTLLNAALQAPTSFNIQNWRFVKVEDKKLRQDLRAAAWDQAQVTDASMLLILCGDLKAWEKEPQRYWRHADNSVQDIILPALDGFYRNKEVIQRDEAMRSCGFAAQTLMLTAKDLGYDSCPMIGFDSDKVAELIKLPNDHVIAMMLAIGKGVKEACPKPGQLKPEEVVFTDTF